MCFGIISSEHRQARRQQREPERIPWATSEMLYTNQYDAINVPQPQGPQPFPLPRMIDPSQAYWPSPAASGSAAVTPADMIAQQRRELPRLLPPALAALSLTSLAEMDLGGRSGALSERDLREVMQIMSAGQHELAARGRAAGMDTSGLVGTEPDGPVTTVGQAWQLMLGAHELTRRAAPPERFWQFRDGVPIRTLMPPPRRRGRAEDGGGGGSGGGDGGDGSGAGGE